MSVPDLGGNSPHPAPFCYQWIAPEDVLRHSMASFYTACRYTDAACRAFPEGPHPDRASWIRDLLEILEARLMLAQYAVDGTPRGDDQVDAAEYRETLSNYTEPFWPVDIAPILENPLDIHSRASHNENPR